MAEQAPIALGILTLLSSALELVFAGPSHSQFLSNEDSAALVDFSQRLRELLDTQLKVASEGQAFPSELSSEAYRIAKEYSALLNETWMTIKQPHIRNLQRLQEHVQKRFRVLLEDLSRLEISQHLHTTNERLEDSSADLANLWSSSLYLTDRGEAGLQVDVGVASWLPDLSQGPKQRSLRNRRAAGSSHYILRTTEFNEWIHAPTVLGSNRCLCYRGAAGVGKTVLSSFVIDHLLSTKLSQKIGVAFFYFDYSSNSSLGDILGSILKQLCRSAESSSRSLQELYKMSRGGTSLAVVDVLRTISNLSQDEAFIVFDGLDEWTGNSGELISLMMRLTFIPRVKLFLTSRPREWIEPLKPIDIQNTDEESLQSYINARIDTNPNADFLVDEVTKMKLVKDITRKCQGSFLWVTLAIPILLKQLTRHAMKRELYYMPRGLSEMLDRTFASIARQSRAERNLARHTLFWLALGVGQLSPTAICEAFAVEQEDSVLNEDKIPAPQMLYRVCLGLISIDNDTGAISLLHNSIRDHIRENDKSLYRDGEEKKNDGEREIARICIQYLLLQDFSRFYDTNGNYIVPQLEKLSLLNYAACHWDEHARRTNDSDVTKLCLALLDDRKRLSTCLQIRYNDTNLMELEEILPFHLAARFGLLEVIQILIANNYGIVNQPDDRGSMPLHEAAKAGRTEVVKVLLTCNASQTVYDADSKSPLYWSVRNGHDEVFRILQNEIAQIRGLDSVLEAAAENGNMLVIESLLESSLAVVQDSLLKALLAAVRHSHEYATKILLYHFPRHRHRASELADALCEAVQSGNESIADIILSWGADPNSQDNAGHSPVHYAAKEGHAALMEQLLHAGADVNIVDTSDGTTPLLQAVRRRDVALVVRLIHFGANVQARIESSGSTVFHEAVLTGNVDIIDQLVDAGADFMAYDLSHTQPWELAHGPFLEELHKRHLIPPGRIPFLHEQNLSHASTINDPGSIDYLTVGHGSMDVSPDYETAELDGRDDRLIGPEQGVVNLDMQEIVSWR